MMGGVGSCVAYTVADCLLYLIGGVGRILLTGRSRRSPDMYALMN